MHDGEDENFLGTNRVQHSIRKPVNEAPPDLRPNLAPKVRMLSSIVNRNGKLACKIKSQSGLAFPVVVNGIRKLRLGFRVEGNPH